MSLAEVSEWGDELSPARGHGLPVAKYDDGGKWRPYARCREDEKSTFFIEGQKGYSAKVLAARREMAILVCAECEVRLNCLNYAVRNDERFGVWGGVDFSRLSSTERLALLSRVSKLNL